jgi:hypothetical protein
MTPLVRMFRQPPSLIIPNITRKISVQSADSLEKEKERMQSERGITNSYRF